METTYVLAHISLQKQNASETRTTDGEPYLFLRERKEERIEIRIEDRDLDLRDICRDRLNKKEVLQRLHGMIKLIGQNNINPSNILWKVNILLFYIWPAAVL